MPSILDSTNFSLWLSQKRISFEEEDEGVKNIIQDVKKNQDQAVRKWTLHFDKVDIENFELTEEERQLAIQKVDSSIMASLEKAKQNIWEYHQVQKQYHWSMHSTGAYLGQLVKPIAKAGIYVPGGKALYPSTVLMTAIPAKIAGVKEISMITPPQKDGSIHPVLVAAATLCGVDRIFKAGGVQGVAALAYGTQTFPKVSKIVGPGNRFVTLAKKYLYGSIDIDSLAGPSEVMIVVDKETNIEYIVADAFSQAEHSEDSQSIILAPDISMAQKIRDALLKALFRSPRKNILEKSILENSAIVVYQNHQEAFDLINLYAPEHLEFLSESFSYLEITEKVENAGAIFIGPYSPVAIGDYFAGPNHTLPTSGTALYASPLGVYDFVKYSSIIHYSQQKIKENHSAMIMLAELEGFYEHAESIRVRCKE